MVFVIKPLEYFSKPELLHFMRSSGMNEPEMESYDIDKLQRAVRITAELLELERKQGKRLTLAHTCIVVVAKMKAYKH